MRIRRESLRLYGVTDRSWLNGERLYDQVEKALKAGDKVQLTGFGSFEVKERAERMGRNPRTGAEVKIPVSKAPVFKPGKSLKDAVQ